MANSRRSRPVDRGSADGGHDRPGTTESVTGADATPVLEAVRDALVDVVASRPRECPPVRVAVALSGGRDSIALLDAFACIARDYRIELSALHIHHGLSASAEAWAAFCLAECKKRDVPLVVDRVRVERRGGMSLEATARAARYSAFAAVDADFIALAHHADDQAETVLLQLLRGAGPHGLAAMPAQRATRPGPVLLRPLLALPRSAIDAYAKARALAWVDDESNADTDVRRNFIRHEIAPRLAAAFPGYPATLARSAAHQAESAALIDELAAQDAASATLADPVAGLVLDRVALVALASSAPHRARNLLRWFLRQHHLRAPSTARLEAMHDQLVRAAPDARVRLAHCGAEIGIHRNRIIVHSPTIGAFEIPWRGEPRLALPHGTLEFAADPGNATAPRAALPGHDVVVRARSGGERVQFGQRAPTRALKRVLQEAGMPHWLRDSLPLVFCGGTLAVVPGIGVAFAFHAAPGAAGYVVNWRPTPPGA